MFSSNFYLQLIIGAGCIGAAIARELSRYKIHTCWVEAADDVSQGATKGNSGIVHAGYDDTPGTNRAKYWYVELTICFGLDRPSLNLFLFFRIASAGQETKCLLNWTRNCDSVIKRMAV